MVATRIEVKGRSDKKKTKIKDNNQDDNSDVSISSWMTMGARLMQHIQDDKNDNQVSS